MAAAANFAWVNRSSMTFLARQAFAKMFEMAPDDLGIITKTCPKNIGSVHTKYWLYRIEYYPSSCAISRNFCLKSPYKIRK